MPALHLTGFSLAVVLAIRYVINNSPFLLMDMDFACTEVRKTCLVLILSLPI